MSQELLRYSRLAEMFECRTKWDEWRNNRILAEAEFYQLWSSLAPIIDEKRRHIAGDLDAAASKLKARKHVVDAILDLICDGDEVYLAHGVMRFADRDSLWTLINEILINEDYYFETETDTPRILDGGASYGMALYYFKCLYPKARITAFEPVPRMRELAIDNMRRNGFHDVEVLPCALSDREETATFYVSNTYTMAGSLTERRLAFGDDLAEIEVQCKRLSSYLDEPVHYLKLDIEGSESIVIDEAAGKLKNVQHIFCEYHHGMGLPTDRLGKILMILDKAGFEVHVGKSFNCRRTSMHRPMTRVNGSYSAVVWAKNNDWSH